MKTIRCLGCGWTTTVAELPGKGFQCGAHPDAHDYRYIWVAPMADKLEGTTALVLRGFGSVDTFVAKLEQVMPPCTMEGLPLGSVYDGITSLLPACDNPHDIIDLLIERGVLVYLMIGANRSFTDWRQFRIMFDRSGRSGGHNE